MPEANYGDLKATVPVKADKPIALSSAFKAFADSLIVPSSHLKLTAGVKAATSPLATAAGVANVEGLSVEVTPTVPSTLLLAVSLVLDEAGGEALFTGYPRLDAEAAAVSEGRGLMRTAALTTTARMPVPVGLYAIALSAAAHTIQIQGKRSGGGGGAKAVVGTDSHLLYMLVAT